MLGIQHIRYLHTLKSPDEHTVQLLREAGQLGRGNTEHFGDDANDLLLPLNPIDFGDDFIVKQIAGGAYYHHCASSVDGRCKCFGYNNYGLSMR